MANVSQNSSIRREHARFFQKPVCLKFVGKWRKNRQMANISYNPYKLGIRKNLDFGKILSRNFKMLAENYSH